MFFISSFTVVAVAVEWVYNKMGVFEYKNGNIIIYSICTYLSIQSLLIVFYRFLALNERVK
ncbi:hypothetical protein J7E79_04730 [Bacillus sp. ISL-40]|nr:hypothetical protein [Bacillus sp. ISL-40]